MWVNFTILEKIFQQSKISIYGKYGQNLIVFTRILLFMKYFTAEF